MNLKTGWTALIGAGILSAVTYVDQTCPELSWGKLGTIVVGAVWGAWNLHRNPPAPPAAK